MQDNTQNPAGGMPVPNATVPAAMPVTDPNVVAQPEPMNVAPTPVMPEVSQAPAQTMSTEAPVMPVADATAPVAMPAQPVMTEATQTPEQTMSNQAPVSEAPATEPAATAPQVPGVVTPDGTQQM